ncbi:hypothetical protein [Pseudothermotoga thermarum]|uniref:Uncharacterized protein n=1 Tax=Pseudothermotoga thermarum DSM 5069 TaxID=688269 RepID=F7YYT7_9THEM|nr:hypothetical protein [Pseudothermotoga thermarum]AEH51125.1 hypothetical protein Theth_1045 [Pseudothermotoga thermarum DSM 5069]
MIIHEENGVIYYVGFDEPEDDDLDLILQWKTLPVVSLLYDGPRDLKDAVEKVLNEKGVLVGWGDVFYVKLRTGYDMFNVKVRYKNNVLQSFGKVEDFDEEFGKMVSFFFPDNVVPSEGYVVKIADEQIEISKIPNVIKPVTFDFEQKLYAVTILGQKFLVEEGFHKFLGQVVYVESDMDISPTNFFPDAEMVYKASKGFYIYKDQKLYTPDGKIINTQEPFDITSDGRILQKRYTLKVEGSTFSSTLIGKIKDFLLFASGVIAPIDLSWTMRISGPVVEWCAVGDKLFVLDLSSYLRIIDLKTRKILLENHLPFAWAVATDGNYLYVGLEEKILKLTLEGTIVEEIAGKNFGVWKNGLEIFDESIQVVRSGDVFAILQNGKTKIYADTIHFFEDVKKIRFFEWGIVVVCSNGCWVVNR